MTNSTVMLEHGTMFMRLKTANIVQCAERDLRLLEQKRQDNADPMAQYCFANRHVHRARDIAHLVALAYFDVTPKTNKYSTLIVYNDRPLLRDTLIELLTAQRGNPE